MTAKQMIKALTAKGISTDNLNPLEIKEAYKQMTANTVSLKDTTKMALALIIFNSECSNVQNMFFMKKGDNYVTYAAAVCGDELKDVTYPKIRARLVEDLSKVDTKKIKQGDKEVTQYPWGIQPIGMKAHALAVAIVKTVERRKLSFNAAGKAVDVTLFQKFDKKANKGKGEAVTKKQTVTQKSVFKAYDKEDASAFLAKFF